MSGSATVTIGQDVYDVLRTSIMVGNTLTLPGQLDRKLYERTNRVLELLGGKWNRSAKAHLFDGDPAVLVAEALEAGSVEDEVKKYQFYPTPKAVVDILMGLVDPTAHRVTYILEPSAGTGAIALALRDWGHVDVCELNPKMADQLESYPGITLVGGDFLGYEPGPVYDLIVANPPFTRGQDVDHAAHMLELLAPGGRMVTVMSAGVTFRQDRLTAAFRALLHLECTQHKILPLPTGAFAESGTMVNAVVLVADRRA